MEISDEVYINSMNDISKHFQIMLDNKDKKIADLQSQLDQANERLKGAIDRPKFKHYNKYFYIENNPFSDNKLQGFDGWVMEILVAYDKDYLYEYRFDTSCRYIEENMIFATFKEAEKKLKELRGGE